MSPLIDHRVFAAQLLHEKKLYKFRSIDLKQPDRVGDIFRRGSLYCPSPAELNDPWECRPEFVLDSTLCDEDRRAFVESLKQQLAQEFPEDFRAKLAEEIPEDLMQTPELFLDDRYYDSERIRHYLKRVSTRWLQKTADFRICSFAATYEHPLLWAHYADAHRGICIEFDASSIDDFGFALPIIYSATYPTFNVFKGSALQAIALLTTKAAFWEYEKEYRLVGREPYNSWEGAKVHLKTFSFPKERITGVILGCQIDSERRDLVKDWIGSLSHKVRVLQSTVSETKYELGFTEVGGF